MVVQLDRAMPPASAASRRILMILMKKESLVSAGTTVAGIAALMVVADVARECKMCGVKSTDVMPEVRSWSQVGQDHYGGCWPWLHYVKTETAKGIVKRASGKCCLICNNVYCLTDIKIKHKNLAAYLKFKNTGEDASTRHNPFVRAYRRYLELLRAGKAKRLHARL